MKLTLHLVLLGVAFLLFVGAAAITDGHLSVGGATVFTDLGLASTVASVIAKEGGR